MAKSKFPKTEKEFHAWFSNFQQAFASNYKKYGFKPSDVTNLNRWYKSWQNSYDFWNGFNQFYSWYTKYHKSEFANFQGFLSGYWSTIQNSPNFDGSWQKWFGVTAPKTGAKKTTAKKTITRSKTGATKKPTMKMTAPSFWYSWKGGKFWLWANTTKSGGFKLPIWATGLCFQYKTTGGAWKTLSKNTKGRYAHSYKGSKKVWYRAAWLTANGKTGPWSKTTCFNWASPNTTGTKTGRTRTKKAA